MSPWLTKLQHQVIKNLTAVLEAAGTTIDHVVKVNVFLADMKDFSDMNEVYTQYWGEDKPCRTYGSSSQSCYVSIC